MPVTRYVTLKAVEHNRTLFPIGAPMALSDDYAAPLLAAGAIVAQAGTLPTMPTQPGDVIRETLDGATGGRARTFVEAFPSGSGPVFQDGDEAHAIVVAELDGGGNPTGNFTQTAGLFRSAGREEPLQ